MHFSDFRICLGDLKLEFGNRARGAFIADGLSLLGFEGLCVDGGGHILRNPVGHYFRYNILLVLTCR